MVKKELTQLNFLIEHYKDGKKRVYPSKLLDRLQRWEKGVYPFNLLYRAF